MKKLDKDKNKIDHLERELKQIHWWYTELLLDRIQSKIDVTIERLQGQRRDFNFKDFIIEEMKKRI